MIIYYVKGTELCISDPKLRKHHSEIDTQGEKGNWQRILKPGTMRGAVKGIKALPHHSLSGKEFL